MAEELVPVMCYHGGRVVLQGHKPEYEGGSMEGVLMSKASSYQDLSRRMYELTKSDPKQLKLETKCRFPTSGSEYVALEVKDDMTTRMMFGLYPRVYSLELFLEFSEVGNAAEQAESLVRTPPENRAEGGDSLSSSMRCTVRKVLPRRAGRRLDDVASRPSSRVENLEGDSNGSDPDWNASGDEDDEDFIIGSVVKNTCRVLDDDPVSSDSILYIGKVFKDKEVLKQQLQEYSIRRHVEYQVMRTTKKMYNVRCIQKGCPWQVRSRLAKRLQKFKIKYYGGEHTCVASSSVGDHKQCDAKFISKCVAPLVRRRATVTPAEVIEWMKKEYNVRISYSKAWIGLNKALKRIHGSWDDSYAMLQEYLRAVQEANPGTVVQLLTNEKGDVREFHRLFWSFGASIEGFRHVRPVVTVDSAELHGKYSSSLLVATGIDGNDGLFPLAFAVAESETEETWSWFLRCIRGSVTDRDDITILSDRGRGLADAVKSVYPSRFTCHRYCMRQLSCTLRKEFKDEILVNLFWEAVKKTEICEFDEIMKILGERSPEARRWLEDVGVENWSFAHDCGKRFGLMTTNIVETCDSLLKGVRGLPIKSLVGKTLSRLSKIFDKRLEEGSRMLGVLTSSVEAQLIGVANFAAQHVVEPYSSTLFKVYRVSCRPHTVSTEGYTCTCNRYLISGIPCSHIVAVCIAAQLPYHSLCAAYFSAHIYRQTYAAKLHSADEEAACLSLEGAPITPPAMIRKPGRPPSARINKGLPPATYRCSKCKKDGHNFRTCKNALPAPNDAAHNIAGGAENGLNSMPRENLVNN